MSGEFTRCWDTEGLTSVVATRARWRVESKSSESKRLLELEEEFESAGEMGNMGEGGTNTGSVIVEG